MRRHFQLSMLCLAVGLASACKTPDIIVPTENIPTAGFRFINAVPDTNAMDLHFIDMVENSTHYQIGFRDGPATTAGVTGSAQIEYKNTRAGSRHFRIFLDGNTPAIASTVLKDTTVTLEAGKVYTAIMQGNARSGGMNLVVYEEVIADPAANVALRVINTTSNAIDVRTYPASGTAPAAPTWASVPAYSRSSFVTAAPAQMKYNVVAAGGATALVPDALALIGTPASSSAGTSTLDTEGLPGTTQAGSAVTAIVFPPSVVGSNAPQAPAAFLTTGITFMWDRRPPRPAGT